MNATPPICRGKAFSSVSGYGCESSFTSTQNVISAFSASGCRKSSLVQTRQPAFNARRYNRWLAGHAANLEGLFATASPTSKLAFLWLDSLQALQAKASLFYLLRPLTDCDTADTQAARYSSNSSRM